MNSGIKYVLGISILLCAHVYGNEEQKQSYGSLIDALNDADKKNTAFTLHQFDIKYPENENKSFLSCICGSVPQPQITGDEMHDICCDAIESMRSGKRDLDNVYDYVITDHHLSYHNAHRLENCNLNFDIITELDAAGHSVLYIYNISEDTTISSQAHIKRIKKLKNGKVIVNIAKKRWDEMCGAMNLGKRKDVEVEVFGTIPSPLYCYENVLLISGSVAFATLALVYYISHSRS